MYDRQELKASAESYGFDAGWLEQWPFEVLALLVEAARHGLSVELVVEIVEKLGPPLLELIIDMLNKQAMTTLEEDDGTYGLDFKNNPLLDVIVEKYLPIILEKYLPLIVEKYGKQIVELFIEIVLKNLQK